MKQYAVRYGNEPGADSNTNVPVPTNPANDDSDEDNLTEFNRIRNARLAAGTEAASTWQSELRAYLEMVEADVLSPDIDIVEWWQVRYIYIFLLTICFS